MRPALLILPILALTACATPRERCISDANRDVYVLRNLISEARGNLARGYALEERRDVRTLSRICRGNNSDGSTFTYPCSETETFTTTVPVSIDLDAEETKLQQLERRLVQAQSTSDQMVAQCIAVHPE